MPNLRYQATLVMASGITADYATNTWHFASDLGFSDFDEPATDLAAFYSSLRAGLSPNIASSSNLIVKAYNLIDVEPRVPVYEGVFSLTGTPATYPMPAEVSLVLSFQATRVSGEPQARRRGRIFLGPLGYETAYDMKRPTTGFTDTLRDAGQALLNASIAAGDYAWSVWSTVDGEMHAVDNGWVDNAWDTQRRRGLEPTARDTFVTP